MARMLSAKGTCAGLTLAELIVAITILMVLGLMVAPSFTGVIHANRVRAEAGRLMSAVQLARSKAVAHNVPVTVCPGKTDDAGRPRCDGTYAEGWVVFTDASRNRQFDEEVDQVLRAFQGLQPAYRVMNVSGSREVRDAITYRPSGAGGRNLTLLVCPPPGVRIEPTSVILSIVGRPRISRTRGTCPQL